MLSSLHFEPSPEQVRSFMDRVAGLKLHPRPRLLAHLLPGFFRDVPLQGVDLLDIGGGTGFLGLFAAHCGARSVVCLEPEDAGACSNGEASLFRQAADQLGFAQATLDTSTLQTFQANGRQFDVLLLSNSVNHLDEQACIELRHSAEGRERYRRIFARLAELSRPGASLVLTDCSSLNFWPLAGLHNPFAPQIAWHKHQPPEVWVELLREHGFRLVDRGWSSPSSLGRTGSLLFGNGPAAFFFSSHFRLLLRRC